MDEADGLSPIWKKSTRCAEGNCVEVARIGDRILVRDSKDPGGPILKFDFHEWGAFLGGVNGGEFDLSSLSS
jgi:hypothetical protein